MEEEPPDVEMIGASNSKVFKTKKSCKVCGVNAMSNLQYGAIVCAGCRAFFRRIVVNQNEPKLCLFDYGGNQKCEVTAKKRSICPYCRFQKCLEIGMMRDRVIGDGMRKKVKTTSCVQVAQKRPSSPHDHLNNKKHSPETSTSNEGEAVIPINSEKCSMNNIPLQIQEIQNIFNEIHAEVDNPLFLVDHLISGHMNSNTWTISHTKAFLQLIDINIFTNFYRFAYQNHFFNQLNQFDKTLLLNCNAHLFSEYIMARYMVEDTAIDQLTWILGPNVPMDSLLTLADASPIRFEDLNQADGMIVPKVDPKSLVQFKVSLELIKQYFPYPKYHSPLIANLFLFSTSHLKQEELDLLVDKDNIKALENTAKEMIQYGSDEISIEIGTAFLNQLVDTLQNMHFLKEHKVNLNTFSVTDSQYSVPFEKNMIKKLVGLYNDVNHEASGDSVFAETLTEFLIHNTYDPQSGLWVQYYNLMYRRCFLLLKKAFGIGNVQLLFTS